MPRSNIALFDFDGVLSDTSKLKQAISQAIQNNFGESCKKTFWKWYGLTRVMTGRADIPLAIACMYDPNTGIDIENLPESHLLYDTIKNLPSQTFVFEWARQVIEYVRQLGYSPVIFSEGDQFYQRHKIMRSGIESWVDEVMVVDNKPQAIQAIKIHLPAQHYLLFDDSVKNIRAGAAELGKTATLFHIQGDSNKRAFPHLAPNSRDTAIRTLLDAIPHLAIN